MGITTLRIGELSTLDRRAKLRRAPGLGRLTGALVRFNSTGPPCVDRPRLIRPARVNRQLCIDAEAKTLTEYLLSRSVNFWVEAHRSSVRQGLTAVDAVVEMKRLSLRSRLIESEASPVNTGPASHGVDGGLSEAALSSVRRGVGLERPHRFRGGLRGARTLDILLGRSPEQARIFAAEL